MDERRVDDQMNVAPMIAANCAAATAAMSASRTSQMGRPSTWDDDFTILHCIGVVALIFAITAAIVIIHEVVL